MAPFSLILSDTKYRKLLHFLHYASLFVSLLWALAIDFIFAT